jgi:hypothetical protein
MLKVHCVAHWTNIVIQMLSKLPLVSKIKILLQFVYNYYYMLPKHVFGQM